MNEFTSSETLLKSHQAICDEARALMVKKNTDYKAGSGDAFANFRMSKLLRVSPAVGIMIRMQDKMARLLSFIEKGTLAVKEESWHDCCVDLINYSAILEGMLAESTRSPEALEPYVRPKANGEETGRNYLARQAAIAAGILPTVEQMNPELMEHCGKIR